MQCGGFHKSSASFPVMCFLIDFIDIAHKENKTNFIHFLKKR